MSPGYHAFIGFNGAHHCCILVFSYSDLVKESDEEREEREKEKLPPPPIAFVNGVQFLGIDWHDSAQDIDDAIQKAIPTAYIQYYAPAPMKLSPKHGDVAVRPLSCAMMTYALNSVTVSRSKASVRVIKEEVLKLIRELDLDATHQSNWPTC